MADLLDVRGAGALSSRLDSVSKSAAGLNRSMIETGHGIGFASNQWQRGTITMENFGMAFSTATRKVLVWQTAIFAIYGVMKKLVEIIGIWRDLEVTLARIGITTGAVGKGLSTYFTQAADIAVDFGMQIEKVLRGMDLALRATASLEKQGQRTAVAMSLLRSASTLANIAGMDYAQSIDILVGSLRQTGMGLHEGQILLDKWVAVAKTAAVSVNDLSQGFAIMADAARAAGLNVDQINGLIAALSETVTLGPVEVGNAIRALMSTLYNPKSISLMQKYGVAVHDSAGEARSFWDVMTQLSAMKEGGALDESRWLDIARAAGAGQRRYAQFMALLNNFGQAMKVAGVSSFAESGVAMDANKRIVETLTNAFDQFTASQRKFFMFVGDNLGLISNLSSVLGTLASVFDTLTRSPSALMQLGKAIAFVTVSLLSLKLALMSLKWMGVSGKITGGLARLTAPIPAVGVPRPYPPLLLGGGLTPAAEAATLERGFLHTQMRYRSPVTGKMTPYESRVYASDWNAPRVPPAGASVHSGKFFGAQYEPAVMPKYVPTVLPGHIPTVMPKYVPTKLVGYEPPSEGLGYKPPKQTASELFAPRYRPPIAAPSMVQPSRTYQQVIPYAMKQAEPLDAFGYPIRHPSIASYPPRISALEQIRAPASLGQVSLDSALKRVPNAFGAYNDEITRQVNRMKGIKLPPPTRLPWIPRAQAWGAEQYRGAQAAFGGMRQTAGVWGQKASYGLQRAGAWGTAPRGMGGAMMPSMMAGMGAYAITGDIATSAGAGIASGIGFALGGPIGMVEGGFIGSFIGAAISDAFKTEADRMKDALKGIAEIYKIDISERAMEILDKGLLIEESELDRVRDIAYRAAPEYPGARIAAETPWYKRMWNTASAVLRSQTGQLPTETGIGYGPYAGQEGGAEWERGVTALPEIREMEERGFLQKDFKMEDILGVDEAGKSYIKWNELTDMQKMYIALLKEMKMVDDPWRVDTIEAATEALDELLERNRKLAEIENEFTRISLDINDIISERGLKARELGEIEELNTSKLKYTNDQFQEMHDAIIGSHYGFASLVESTERLGFSLEGINYDQWIYLQRWNPTLATQITNTASEITNLKKEIAKFEEVTFDQILGKDKWEDYNISIKDTDGLIEALADRFESTGDSKWNDWIDLVEEYAKNIRQLPIAQAALPPQLQLGSVYKEYGDISIIPSDRWEDMNSEMLKEMDEYVRKEFKGGQGEDFADVTLTLIDEISLETKELVGTRLGIALLRSSLDLNTDAVKEGLEGEYNVPSSYMVPSRHWYYATTGSTEFGPEWKTLWASWENFVADNTKAIMDNTNALNIDTEAVSVTPFAGGVIDELAALLGTPDTGDRSKFSITGGNNLAPINGNFGTVENRFADVDPLSTETAAISTIPQLEPIGTDVSAISSTVTNLASAMTTFTINFRKFVDGMGGDTSGWSSDTGNSTAPSANMPT